MSDNTWLHLYISVGILHNRWGCLHIVCNWQDIHHCVQQSDTQENKEHNTYCYPGAVFRIIHLKENILYLMFFATCWTLSLLGSFNTFIRTCNYIAPLLDNWNLHLPWVHFRSNTDLLWNIKTVLHLLQRRDQFGDMLAGSLWIQ